MGEAFGAMVEPTVLSPSTPAEASSEPEQLAAEALADMLAARGAGSAGAQQSANSFTLEVVEPTANPNPDPYPNPSPVTITLTSLTLIRVPTASRWRLWSRRMPVKLGYVQHSSMPGWSRRVPAHWCSREPSTAQSPHSRMPVGPG